MAKIENVEPLEKRDRKFLSVLFVFGIVITLIFAASFRIKTALSESGELPEGVLVWLAEKDGILKLEAGSGELLLDLNERGDARVIEVDSVRENVWVYSPQTLCIYSLSGTLVHEILLDDAHGSTVHASLDVKSGALYLSLGQQLFGFSEDGRQFFSSTLTEAVQGLTLIC